MRFSALCDASTAASIGAQWLERQLAPVADFGRRALATDPVFVHGDETAARTAIERVASLARDLDRDVVDDLRSALGTAPDPTAIAVRSLDDEPLGDVDFYELGRFVDAIGRIAARAHGTALAASAPQALETLARVLAPGRSASFAFYLVDAFQSDLAAAREAMLSTEAAYASARGTLAATVAQELGRSDLRDGEFIVMRDALRGPLPPGVRVVREAPTYYACELTLTEDAQRALAARDRAAARVAALEERARQELTREVRASARAIAAAVTACGTLDVLLARVAFAQRFGGCVPSFHDAPRLTLEDARNVPLELDVRGAGRTYVPISLEIDGAAVITGPNMGGKSAALATAGFCVLCAAAGLPIPAQRATMQLASRVAWVGIGLGGEGAGLLSAFGHEVVALRGVLEGEVRAALVLVDEFARTTTPREGRALSIALVRTLRERGAITVLATHLADIAEAAGADHLAIAGLRALDAGRAEDLTHALDILSRAIDYRVVRASDQSAKGDALSLAALLGLDEQVIEEARRAL